MDPKYFYQLLVHPSLYILEKIIPIPQTPEADQLVMTIAGQESDWNARKQYGGPARSYWQFEQGGGVAGVLSHPATSGLIRKVCDAIDIDTVDTSTIYEAMAWSSFLGCTMARLLLYTDPAALPKVGDIQGSWDYYYRNWRPGAPHPEVWPDKYNISLQCMRKANA